ncbi:reverse transcriptase domain-containing protein [Tanacetum coccineum]
MISFPPLGEEDGTEGPMVIEAEVGGHLVHRMYLDGGTSSEILYEHCFNQLRQEIKNQMVPATTYLVVAERSHCRKARNITAGVAQDLGPRNASTCGFDKGHKRKDSSSNSSKYPETKLYNSSTLTEEGRKKLCAYPEANGRNLKPMRLTKLSKKLHGKQEEIPRRGRNIQNPQKDKHEAKPKKMHLRDEGRRISRPRISVKGQILADFIVERPEEDSADTPMKIEEKLSEPWILFTDGSSCADGSGAGLILTSPEGMEFTYAQRFGFDATNNEAEYEALIAGLRIAEQIYGLRLGKSKDAHQWLPDVHNQTELKEKSINEAEVLAIVEEEGETWMTPIHDYITGGILPAETDRARAVKHPGKVKFLIVAIDYFTKWIEAKSVATITGNQVKKFVWDNIVCIFGLPGEIISDNGKQFRDNPFKDWCEKLCIRQRFASVKHPQTNGLVERANRSLREGIKARLEARSKNWMEEISHVLWAHRTMIKSSNGDTPFSLTYKTEVVIPVEIGMPTLRTAEVDVVRNDETLEVNLDLLEERREQTAIREAKSKRKMEKYYNAKVRSTNFKLGDLVYRNNDASHAEQGGKLGPKWEGPYEVTEALGKGAYKLRDRDGKQLPRT